MNLNRNIYLCPRTKRPLSCHSDQTAGDEVLSGRLFADGTPVYPIRDGIPDFLLRDGLRADQSETLSYYENAAKVYDDVAHLSFAIQKCDEETTRREFVERLHLKPDHRVLELACGTGRDSVNIARALSTGGRYYLQDISRAMIDRCRQKLHNTAVPVEYSIGDSCRLPFPDRWFDAVFSFGGLGVFGDIAASLREIVRVARVGARVVVGDESLAPWLSDTEYGRILLNNNPLFKAGLPLAQLPPDVRDVRVQWVVGGVYYLIDFAVGEGEPPADFDMEIPGARGGTLRTRYYGRLEGVTPAALELARRAGAKTGKSMHSWLDGAVRSAALADLGEKTPGGKG
jgi:ubiquinone/menaquinone biosynthesis C-methylase UbiE